MFGIEANGHFRAYSEKSMHDLRQTVINDLIGDVPATITYCAIADCAIAFTTADRGKALDIELGGLQDGKMLVRHEGAWIWQATGEPIVGSPKLNRPLTTLPLIRTKWMDWRLLHPDKAVYIGIAWRP